MASMFSVVLLFTCMLTFVGSAKPIARKETRVLEDSAPKTVDQGGLDEQTEISMALAQCKGMDVGDRFIQFGEWRIGDYDGTHASISHKDGKTAHVFKSDGTLLAGPLTDYSTWSRDAGTPASISYGKKFIQLGEWRFGDYDGTHASISHKDGKTAHIFRSDGTIHPGPRSDYGTWSRNGTTPAGISWGNKFVQVGKWRLGDSDGQHASIAHKDGKTAHIFRSDGTLHPGPRTDYGTWSRKEKDCESENFDG